LKNSIWGFVFAIALCLSFVAVAYAQTGSVLWQEDFNYGSVAQMEAAGWSVDQNPAGVTVDSEGVILNGANGDALIRYYGTFPAVNEWKVESRSMWPGEGHSGSGVNIITEKHSYGFTADGWYSQFGLYRDNVVVLTFGTYQEVAGAWLTLVLVKQGNTLSMYFNGALVNTYEEQDTQNSPTVRVDIISPWRGDVKYDYYRVVALDGSGGTSDNEIWCPQSPAMGIAAPVVSIVMVGAVSLLMGAITIPIASISNGFARATAKAKDLLPNAFKSWLEDFIASRHRLGIEEKKGSPFIPTKPELLVYIISVVVLALSFAYAKVDNLSQILTVLPVIFVTSILVGLVKSLSLNAFTRSKGVWSERKFWYIGLTTFIVTTLAFRMPFSTPARNVSFKPKMTDRLRGILACCDILISLAFAAFFFGLFLSGLTLIGSTGLAMCVIGAFFDTYPIVPMNGKTVYDFKKPVWAALFALTLGLYVAWLLLI